MKTKLTIITLIFLHILLTVTNLSAQEHESFTSLLKRYVVKGLVDYKNLKDDNQLDEYLSQLSNTNPDKLSRNQKLAFWINAYNAFTLQVVRDNYPIETITELHTGGKVIGYFLGKTVWDKEFITIKKKKYSLGDIEHNILRKMNEPRIHFAIVCASISCPELLNEAFEAEKINDQLENQARRFLNDKSRNHFDLKNRKAYLSKIFDWFDKDFGDSEKEVLKYVSQFIPENISKDIKNNLSNWEISYRDYDWNLNKIK